jgi:uncharacterized protein YuzE
MTMPTNRTVRVVLDVEAGLAYVTLSDAGVARTVALTDAINLDLDEFNVVVGMEVLDLDAEIPFSRLVDDFHVPTTTVEILRLMRPSVAEFHGRVSPTTRQPVTARHRVAA